MSRWLITLTLVCLALAACAEPQQFRTDVQHTDTPTTSDTSTTTADTTAADTFAPEDTTSPEDTTNPEDTLSATDLDEQDTTAEMDSQPPDVAQEPDPPSGVNASPGLANHTIEVTWEGVSNATAYHLYYSTQPITDSTGPKELVTGQTSFTHTNLSLAAGLRYYRVTSVDAGSRESALSLEVSTRAPFVFSGAAADFRSGDAIDVVATASSKAYLTWSDAVLFVGLEGDLTSDQDALLIAIDTDPASDSAGSPTAPTVGQNGVLLPFNADFLVEMRPGSSSTATLHTWSGSSWSSQALSAQVGGLERMFDGVVDEVAIEKSALGDPQSMRVMVAAFNTQNGYTFALAPEHPGATHVLGFFASAAGGLDLPSPWSPFDGLNGASTVHDAAALVAFSVDAVARGTSGDIKISSSARPFSTTSGNTAYALVDDGTHGDANSNDDIYSGRFNLGGTREPIYFVFTDGTGEFGDDTERVFTPVGGEEVVSRVDWGTRYSATKGARITFAVSGAPSGTAFVRGDTLPLDWVTGLSMSNAAGVFSTEVTFTSVPDPVGYKFFSGDWENGIVGDRRLNLDVIGVLASGTTPTQGALTLPVAIWNTL